MRIHRSFFYYESTKDDSVISDAIKANSLYGDGFWKIYARLRRLGNPWNHKRVYRVYKSMYYNKRSRLKKRLPARIKNPLLTPKTPNHTWSIDFVSDALNTGRKFRVLNILDDFDRSSIAQEMSMSMPAERVIKLLEKIIWIHGKPNNIRCDNGPEFISRKFQNWCKANEITILYTQPGCPTQNSFIERFNGSYRRGVLDSYIFRTLQDVRDITEKWREDYNNQRPHHSLGNKTPYECRKEFINKKNRINLAV